MNEKILLQLSAFSFLEMVFVQGTGNDTFRMGGMNDDNGYCNVAVDDFWIGKYPVTRAQWEAVMGEEYPNPSFFKGKDRPVEQVSWYAAMDFIRLLNEKMKAQPILKGKKFTLPTEAQWEYAARGGVHWRDNFEFSGSNAINEVAWYYNNSHEETKLVGLKLPNQLGIYDMSGNVREWCLSKDFSYPYHEDDGRNVVDDSNDWRVSRGGDSLARWYDCTTASRTYYHPLRGYDGDGFRLCLLPV